MKINQKILIIFICLLISQKLFSQHLTFNDLLNLYKSNTEKNDEILLKKGFEFTNTQNDIENKVSTLNWTYQKSKNEFFIKECSNLFLNKCGLITYMTTDLNHFIVLKNSMKSMTNTFLYTNTNENGILSHHYLIPGPLEAIFSTIPISSANSIKVYILDLKKMDVKMSN